jgi:two-component system response regulator MtrA
MKLIVVSQDHSVIEHVEHLLGGEFVILGLRSLSKVFRHKPDLLIIDITTIQQPAQELFQDLRVGSLKDKPILLFTPRIDAQQAAELLDAGADDLLRKPFADTELLARVRALTRWTKKEASNRRPHLRLIEFSHTVYVEQQAISLTPMEFRLLSFLCQNRDRYFSADELLTELWDYPSGTGDTALVRNHIRNLRRKLEQDPDHPTILVSRYGQGYTIQAVVQRG